MAGILAGFKGSINFPDLPPSVGYSRSNAKEPTDDEDSDTRSIKRPGEDDEDLEKMINDEVIQEIRKFKGEFITYADTEIKFTLQNQINQEGGRIDTLYAKFTDMLSIPAIQKDIKTINSYLEQLELDKSNIANEIRGMTTKLTNNRNNIDNNARDLKDVIKQIKALVIPDTVKVEEITKQNEQDVQDLQMRITVQETIADKIKNTDIATLKNKIRVIEESLDDTDLTPPPIPAISFLKPIAARVSTLREAMVDTDEKFPEIQKLLVKMQKWTEIIPNINTRLEIVEKVTKRPGLVPEYYKGILP